MEPDVVLTRAGAVAPARSAGEAPAAALAAAANVDPWPRSFDLNTVTLRVYQPQVENWEGNRLEFRAAVEATPDSSGKGTYGVIWGTARTEVNREARRVTLEDLRLTRSNFPTVADNGAGYREALEQQMSGTARSIAFDRLQASLAASRSHPLRASGSFEISALYLHKTTIRGVYPRQALPPRPSAGQAHRGRAP